MAQPVQQLATVWAVREARFLRSRPERPGAGHFRRVKRPQRGVNLAPYLMPRLKKGQSYTCTPCQCLPGWLWGKGRGKVRPITDHEGPRGGVEE